MKYRVELTGLAVMEQTQVVEARSEDEARVIAVEQVSEFVWRYKEIWDGADYTITSVKPA